MQGPTAAQRPVSRMALMVSVMLASFQLLAQDQGKERPVEHPTFYRTVQIDKLSIFYREAGPTFPFGRGDMGRTPFLTQTDLAVNQVVKTGEHTYLRFDANAFNHFNQAAVISGVTQMNRGNSAISSQLLPVDQFFKGYDVGQFVFPGSPRPP